MKPVAPVTRTVVMRAMLSARRHAGCLIPCEEVLPRRASSRAIAGVAVTPCSSTDTMTVKATVDHSHGSSGTCSWLVA